MFIYNYSLIKRCFQLLLACLVVTGCIENDIPYPRTQADFLTIVAEKELRSALIDTKNRVVTLYLDETANIYNVNITEYTLTEGAYINGTTIHNGIDLSEPISVTLTLYQDYEWTIKAVQDVERYFTISPQVGSAEIDVPGHRVVAYIPMNSSLDNVKVTSIKLGTEVSSMSPNLEGQIVDFTEPVEVKVTAFDRTETWTIYVGQTDSNVNTERVDAWTNVAWVYGTAEAGKDNGFEYREASSLEWSVVPSNWITHDGGSFYARLVHLKANTEYVARAYSEDEYGAEVMFTTGSIVPLTDGSLDDWHQDGKVWNPWAEGGVSFWDTGNKGATTLGQSNSQPTDDTYSGKGKAAKLETKFVGLGGIGKLAAGNLFSGKYVRTDGTNGILDFGREFTARPTKLRGYMKYNCVAITHTNDEMSHLKGEPDIATIYIALTDWTSPYEIRTNPSNRQLFDPDDESVIAYGTVEYGYSVPEYTPFEITLDYKDTQRVPTFILVVASASKYGDYFTGGNGSVLYVDDFSLDYDY